MSEDILPIKGFDGYFVSRDGKIFSNKKGRMKEIKPFLYESVSLLVFKKVKLYAKGRKHTKMVHRIVYETFCGISLKAKEKVYFKDLNTLNCSMDNLTTEFPSYVLEDDEEWIDGFEGRYTIYKGDVYSVWQKDFPKRLKPYTESNTRRYTIYDACGNAYTFYISDNSKTK